MPPVAETGQKTEFGTWLEIRLDRLLSNLETLRAHAGPDAEVMAVVKANAYGHGLLKTAAALDGRVAYLGIASIAEAVQLKEHKIETPVFFFGHPFPNELPALIKKGVTLSVSSLEEAGEISALSQAEGRKTPVHIKIDTGMGRLGIPYAAAEETAERICELPGIRPEGIYTHFPTAESDDGFRENQVREFSFLLMALEKKGITFRYRHAANSAGALNVRTPVLNLIRPGLMLYGMTPGESLRDAANLQPVLSFKSRIISLKRFAPGTTVGYGRSYRVMTHTTIAVLPVGYSHGYPFAASNRSWVLHRGSRFPIAGRVSMDYLAVDLGNAPAGIGDAVTLIGEDGSEKIRAEDIAGWAGTIPYEITTRLSPGLPRLYR